MKYLKRFNESLIFTSVMIGEIKQTIKDILLPISDMGYEIDVTNDVVINGELPLIIRVVSYTDPPLKMNDEVKDEFIRMNDYLESLGINSVEALYVKIIDTIGKTSGNKIRLDRSGQSKIHNMENCELRNLLFVAKIKPMIVKTI
jgi:hypothetical protein